MISPTVGRVVWFYQHPTDTAVIGDFVGPLAAIVASVISDAEVNLAVIDPNGVLSPRTNVRLVQPGEEPPADSVYCQWMPYQIGQAAKTEEAQKMAQGPVRRGGRGNAKQEPKASQDHESGPAQPSLPQEGGDTKEGGG